MVTKMTPFYLNYMFSTECFVKWQSFVWSNNVSNLFRQQKLFTKVLLKRDLDWPFSHPAVFALQLTSLYKCIFLLYLLITVLVFPKEYLCFEAFVNSMVWPFKSLLWCQKHKFTYFLHYTGVVIFAMDGPLPL